VARRVRVAASAVVAVFSVSTFVVGPAISGADGDPAPALRAPGATPQPGSHEERHR
jgi:hypothetical protein